jgi:tetratricopeptide (TPR) repeat protein
MIPFLGRAPECPSWHSEEGYNPDLAVLFMGVYDEISNEAHRPPPSQMTRAWQRLRVARRGTAALSAHQQFALASLDCQLVLGGAKGEPVEHVLPRARDLAERLDDPLALAECDFLDGWRYQGVMDYTKAAAHFASAVARLKRLRDVDPQAGDAVFELRACAGLAMHRFLLADYDAAECCVEEGLNLSLSMPAARSSRALLLWTRALLQRWRGNLEDALTCAFTSADLLERDAVNATFGRIQGIAGEIALDLADRSSAERPAHGRAIWLAIGRARIEEAARIAARVKDHHGLGLAMLGQVRYQRMSPLPEERRTNRERLATILKARDLAPDDATLLCQVETALGREYDASGDHAEALKHYQSAIDLVDQREEANATTHDGPTASLARALLVWPKREILRSREMTA